MERNWTDHSPRRFNRIRSYHAMGSSHSQQYQRWNGGYQRTKPSRVDVLRFNLRLLRFILPRDLWRCSMGVGQRCDAMVR